MFDFLLRCESKSQLISIALLASLSLRQKFTNIEHKI